MEITQRRASCTCGQLRLQTQGEPVRISMCHCHVCQQRTGSAFGAQLRFPRTQVSNIEGEATSYVRPQENGGAATFHFCPRCGATLYYELSHYMPECIAIPVGAFAGSPVPAPTVSVYESRKHDWVTTPASVTQRMD